MMLKMGFRSWRKVARDRAAWKLILKEAKVLQGPCSQWRSKIHYIEMM
jgi:hypothetical protein